MSIINWEVVKPALWTGVGGVFVGMFLLSYGFGFMSRTSAEKLASTNSEKAVVAVLAPICADKFRALPDVGARTATLVADKDDFYKMREAFPEAMITLPDKSYPDSDLTAACAALILAPPKTADIKQYAPRSPLRIVAAPERRLLFEEIINVVHRLAPQSRIAFSRTPADPAEAARGGSNATIRPATGDCMVRSIMSATSVQF
jgi:hypothetical protein